MAVTAQFLKNIMAEARPIIERQMNDAKIIAGLRTVVANNGGDWGALKALIKAHVEDEADDTGDGKRVQKILEKADSSTAYADMLGLANMNEKNFSEASQSYAEVKGGQSDRMDGFVSIPFNVVTGEITEHEQPETVKKVPEQGTPFEPPAFLVKERKPLRPNCLHPENCAGYGTHTCHSCTVAAREVEPA